MQSKKVCSQCGQEKSLDEFNKLIASEDGYAYECRECAKARRSAYKNKTREYNLKYRYSVSKAEYNAMFIKQRGVCAICGKPESRIDKNGKPKWLVVDHNATTGEVRGLLCSNCNTGIGLLGDSKSNLSRAITYLEERGNYGEE